MRKLRSYGVLSGAALVFAAAVSPVKAATTLIYGFDDPTINGFVKNGATVSYSTTTGVTEGVGAMEIANSSTQTYGGAVTATVPADFYDSTSFNIDVTITTTPEVNGVDTYFDLVPVFFSSDGELDPDLSNPADYINIGGVAPGTYTYTVNLDSFDDPDGVLTSDATPGEVLAADQAFDVANGVTPLDSITGFQLTVEHGSGTPTTLYVDNVTIPATSVPEPASLGVICLGGLALSRRRARRV